MLPTRKDSDELRLVDRSVAVEEHSYLALRSVNKMFRSELPSLTSLLRLGAVVPTLFVMPAYVEQSTIRDLQNLIPFLSYASRFEIQGFPVYEDEYRYGPPRPIGWNAWLRAWGRHKVTRHAMR